MDELYLRWCQTPSNWGDVLSKELAEKISGKKVKWVNTNDGKDIDKYISIGSILGWADEYTTVWGSGFISQGSKLSSKPRSIRAVRGPLTLGLLKSQGIDCKDVALGDPALLYPRYYFPKIRKKYKLGIIPHYVDQSNSYFAKLNNSGILVINILDPIDKVVNEILSCEMIASSSLHGIIAADSYGVPSTWLEFSNKVIGSGFKFRDYYMSVHRKIEEPLFVTESTRINEILDRCDDYKIDIDLDELYDSCPFKII